MANMNKKDGDQPQANQPQGNPPQGNQQLARQSQGQQGQQGQRGELVRGSDPMQMLLRDPMRLMREFINNPFGMLMSPWRALGVDQMPLWNPNFEVRETDDAFVFKGDLPGIKNEDLDISVTGNRIEISGKRDVENETTEGMLHTYERSYGDFRRSFVVPESADLDQVRCDLKDGVLTMVVPKKQGAGQQSRKIQIGSGSKS